MSKDWSEQEKNKLKELWKGGMGRAELARVMSVSSGSISGQLTRLRLSHRVRSSTKGVVHYGSDKTGTKFPTRVVDPIGGVLKSGENNRKLGRWVTKGAWKGFPIYSLTLEERATCPTTCKIWGTCYGNNMHLAKRYKHGPELEKYIHSDLVRISLKYPNGFIVRLHTLGDFYSVEYVKKWLKWLEEFPNLRVFGYTAHNPASEIGMAIAAISGRDWKKFAIRWSGSSSFRGAVVINDEHDAPSQSRYNIVCPAQTGKSESCSTCGLCWEAPAAAIHFLSH